MSDYDSDVEMPLTVETRGNLYEPEDAEEELLQMETGRAERERERGNVGGNWTPRQSPCYLLVQVCKLQMSAYGPRELLLPCLGYNTPSGSFWTTYSLHHLQSSVY